MQTRHTSCCLCEAACGLTVEIEGDQVLTVRGDRQDALSRGHLCPKGAALKEMHHDPSRLRTPMRRVGSTWEPIGWDEATALVVERLDAVRRAHGPDAVALYAGNPTTHDHGAVLYGLLLDQALGTRNFFSSQSVDALPRLLASLWMYGNQALLPVPDLERTDLLVVLGANPLVSNGSVMRAPDMRHRLEELQARGGRLVVLDPRRTETARMADQHLAVRPGTDAMVLLALCNALFERGQVRPDPALVDGAQVERLRALVTAWPAERVASHTGLSAEDIRGLADQIGRSPTTALYGRMGTCVQEFGTLSSWLIDVVSLLTGNMDRPGGSMFGAHPADLPRIASWLGQRGSFDRWRSPATGLPEFNGELPSAAFAAELESGHIRALITHAGNPVLSLPNGKRVERALEGLDFIVSIDIYLNETTRHAHLILPSTFGLENAQIPLIGGSLAIRNHARFDEAVMPTGPDRRRSWEILYALSKGLLARQGLKGKLLAYGASPLLGRGPEALIDLLMRVGPRRMSLQQVRDAPHGLDLGPLEPRLREMLATPSGKVELLPARLVEDIGRLEQRLTAPIPDLSLIGRRDLRSNNSWMHNVGHLARGRRRCTLLVHPKDAAVRGLCEGQSVTLRSSVGEIVVPVQISDEMVPGVVSLPHGWGHGRAGTVLPVANAHAGVNVNEITSDQLVDVVSGTAALNGMVVVLLPVDALQPGERGSRPLPVDLE